MAVAAAVAAVTAASPESPDALYVAPAAFVAVAFPGATLLAGMFGCKLISSAVSLFSVIGSFLSSAVVGMILYVNDVVGV